MEQLLKSLLPNDTTLLPTKRKSYRDKHPELSYGEDGEDHESILVRKEGPITIITLNRPKVRNAINKPTAKKLRQAFQDFDRDHEAKVAVLYGGEDCFCAGFDLKAFNRGDSTVTDSNAKHGPIGPTWMQLSKPVIAAIAGYAVAGGMELALWCDIRVMDENAKMGVFCRRWGVPLIDGGTVRLPRLIGQSRALDIILTGREIDSRECKEIGLCRVAPKGEVLQASMQLAQLLTQFPQTCMNADRMNVYRHMGERHTGKALRNEFARGYRAIRNGEASAGAAKFSSGSGRHGSYEEFRPVAKL